MAVAEQLAAEFAQLPNTVVIRVVTDCAAKFPSDDAHFIEQAARARLAEETATAPPPETAP